MQEIFLARSIQAGFKEFVSTSHLFNTGDRLLLAVSGGVDSMVMCDLFTEAGFNYGIAHCNFQLRGEESVRDETFVRRYAEDHQIPFYLKRFDTEAFAAKQKISIQEAARELRYEWFESIRAENDFTFIAAAHHMNDHIETLLINFFKGTGIHGLHGIRPKQGKVIRPLLFLAKEEILQYVEARDLAFVEDISNLSDKYTRNYIRHQIIPRIKEIFPGIEKQLEKNIGRFSEAEMLYDQAIEAQRSRLVTSKGGEFFIPVLKLKKSTPLSTICYELFKSWNFSFEQSQQVIAMMDSESGRSMTSSTHRVIKDRKWFIITPIKTETHSITLVQKGDSQVDVPGLSLRLTELAPERHSLPRDESTASIDADKLAYPLILRPWRQGDYFYPLGLNKKKKVSRFFIDLKVPLHEKEKVWVLESGSRVVWVVGMRIDHRFRIVPATRSILQIKASKK